MCDGVLPCNDKARRSALPVPAVSPQHVGFRIRQKGLGEKGGLTGGETGQLVGRMDA